MRKFLSGVFGAFGATVLIVPGVPTPRNYTGVGTPASSTIWTSPGGASPSPALVPTRRLGRSEPDEGRG